MLFQFLGASLNKVDGGDKTSFVLHVSSFIRVEVWVGMAVCSY